MSTPHSEDAMTKEDMIYNEVVCLRKEMSALRKDFISFKIKVIIYIVIISASIGTSLKFFPVM